MLQSHSPICFWITGLPASGKTTLGLALRNELCRRHETAYLLDGDELRRGLCSDLGLSEHDRAENIRRAGEVARLMVDAGVNTVCAFVSPFSKDRARVRQLFPTGRFFEIYLATPLDTCASRDPKGLYAKAKRGEISGLTGFDAPYEIPPFPEFTFNATDVPVDQMLCEIFDKLKPVNKH